MGVLTWFGVGGLVLMFGAYGSHVGFVYCRLFGFGSVLGVWCSGCGRFRFAG